MPRTEAGLAEQGRLLVAGNPRNRDRPAEQIGRGRAVKMGIVVHLGQDRARHADQPAHLLVPAIFADIP
jgi:hypothetical protein